MYFDSTQKLKIIHRLKISNGHINKIIQMVESDEPCIRIVHQIRAVRFALKKVDQILLEDYFFYSLDNTVGKEKLKQEIHNIIMSFNKL